MADRSRAWYRYADETGHKAREFDNSARTDAWLLWSCTTQRTSDLDCHFGGTRRQHGLSRFVAGVTVYFPVFVAGALLHVGDGHATQGDGEIVGTGIEISMEVQFTVRVIKGKRIRWPRGENAEYIFTVGNARPLDQAVQHATTEMLRWLQEDYSLDTTSASLLLGQCVEYDLGNVFDPAYTMVCKLRKALLRFS